MRSTATARIGIIGGGLGGLAAACTLAARRYDVVLFERNAWLGGKAVVHEQAGFRFDMGPTILTLPSVLTRIFAEAGRRVTEALDLVPLDPQWRAFFPGGATLDLYADRERMATVLDTFAPGTDAGKRYGRFLDVSRRLHEIAQRYFFWRPVGSIWDTFDARATLQRSVLTDLLALRPGQSVAGTIRAYMPDPRVAQMLDHFTQYVGSAPDASPAVLCGIAHMQTGEGVWYPRGGTFWEERFPEVLFCFGEALVVNRGQGHAAAEWTSLLAQRLGATQDRLAGAACQRDPKAFMPLLRGRAGIGGVYDLWRATRAWLGGEAFHSAHGREEP